MNITFVQHDLYSLTLFGIEDWNVVVKNIIEHIDFDLAIKYDDYWSYDGDEIPPYADFEEHEIWQFMETNGAITNDNPLVWQFDNSEALNAIAFGFVNADESIIAKTKKRPKIIDFGTKDRDDKIIEYWCGISDYLLTTRMDYSGLVFISKKKYWIDEIATKIEAFYNKNKIRKRKGRKELNA